MISISFFHSFSYGRAHSLAINSIVSFSSFSQGWSPCLSLIPTLFFPTYLSTHFIFLRVRPVFYWASTIKKDQIYFTESNGNGKCQAIEGTVDKIR